jgi:Flp pilus assembly protein TadG
LVEFALVLPVFMLLLLGMLTGGLAYSRKLSVAQAAREGARYGATQPITGALPTDAWLAKVGALTIASSDGELEPGQPGRLVCIAHVTASGSARKWEAIGSAAGVASNGTCIADDGRTGETRVQVVVQRTSKLEALVFTRDLTLQSHAVSRFES